MGRPGLDDRGNGWSHWLREKEFVNESTRYGLPLSIGRSLERGSAVRRPAPGVPLDSCPYIARVAATNIVTAGGYPPNLRRNLW